MRPTIIAVGAFSAAAIAASVGYIASEGTLEPCTVLDKTTVVSGDSHQMRVTTTCGTLVVKDTLLPRITLDAADRYGTLREGSTYRLDTVGWRVPLLSQFPVILDHSEVPA